MVPVLQSNIRDLNASLQRNREARLLLAISQYLKQSHAGVQAVMTVCQDLYNYPTATTAALPHASHMLVHGNRIETGWLICLNDEECRRRFNFHADEIIVLNRFLRVPDLIETPSGCRFTGLEALCLLLARLRSTAPLAELQSLYLRPAAAITEAVRHVCNFIYLKWCHKLRFDTNTILTPAAFKRYSKAICAAGSPIPTFWGFLTCTHHRICHPFEHQGIGSKDHKQCYTEKLQAVRTPDGMYACFFGPEPMSCNDNIVLEKSRLLEKCKTHAVQPGSTPDSPIEERYYQLFGGYAYSLCPQIITPFPDYEARESSAKREWNDTMSTLRDAIQHGFEDVHQQWPLLNAWWSLRDKQSPTRLYYVVAVLLTNARNCFSPNQTSKYYDCLPPQIEEYFS